MNMEKDLINQKIKDITSKYHKALDKNSHFKILSEIAQLRLGKIKDGEIYVNNSTKLAFIDKLGNEFEMSPNKIKIGQWSPYESGKVRDSEYHTKQLEEIALLKGGKIKEGEVYVNNATKMNFIDKLGNEFKIKPSAVKNGRWSPYEQNCSEHICRQIIEQLYNKQFPSSWDIIKREGKKNLQLDGYCQELKIAFEYQGVQHTTGWNGKDKKFQQQSLIEIQKRDKEKKQLCIEKDILLLEINYYKNVKNSQDIINQTIEDVKKSYIKNNILIPDFITNCDIEKIKIDLTKISNLVIMQEELEEIVFEKGGKIKEGEVYIGSTTKMTYIDKLGNEFKMSPSAVKTGNWSPYEAGNIRDSEYHMIQLQEIVKSKGGKIKEGEIYVNSKTKMTFIDKDGYEFEMSPDHIKRGQWSPYESGKVFNNPEYHMKQLEEIALLKGGKIKEGQEYLGALTKMTYIDKLGNEFKMTPNAVKNGGWSPYESKPSANKPKVINSILKIREDKSVIKSNKKQIE